MKWTRVKNKQKGQKIRKEEIAEDWCFVCKDGGSLRVCDYKQCLKAYHPECVGQNDSFLHSKSNWACGWHYCFNCSKTSKYHCFCCPYALCQHCAKSVDFAHIRDSKGLCHNCVKLALLGESDETVDSDGKHLDFRNRETFECLFFEYWLIVKKEENLTSEDLQSANIFLKDSNKRISSDSLSTKSSESNSMSDSYTEDHKKEGKFTEVMKQSIGEPSERKKKKAKPKRKFIGWGSEALIEFLTSLGKETNEKLSHIEVTSIVSRYINENNLFDLKNKRKVVCDARLQALIEKKSFQKNKLYDLLDRHLDENNEVADDEFWSQFSDDNSSDILVSTKKKKPSSTVMKIAEVQERPKSRFASIVEENIKIVFLMKSLVKEMLDNHSPEDFDRKVTGCFGKIRSDPLDSIQKNRCQLVLITGVQRIFLGDEMKVMLQATTGRVIIDLNIEKLLDATFTQDELDDLKKRVEDGLIPRPTIAELELKAKTLHEEITNHAINKELQYLANHIPFLNEKGWREELYKHLDRRELLQSPEGRARMLEAVPQVVAAPAELDIEAGSKEVNVFIVNGEHHFRKTGESILESGPHNSMSVAANEPEQVIAGKDDYNSEEDDHWMW